MTTPSKYAICVDADRPLTCPVPAIIEEVMAVLSLAIPGAIPRSLLSPCSAPLKLPYLLAHLWLRCSWRSWNLNAISYPMLMALPSWLLVSVGGRRSPMSGALTYTRITWALSPMASQVPGVTPGSPLCQWCFGHSSWRGARYFVIKESRHLNYSPPKKSLKYHYNGISHRKPCWTMSVDYVGLKICRLRTSTFMVTLPFSLCCKL